MFTKKTLATALLSTLALSSVYASADNYVIDTKGAHASVNFKISHLGYSFIKGRFDTFSGTYSYDPAKPEASTVSVTIDTNSVNSNHAQRDKHLRSKDFLNVEQFPQATFKSTKVVVGADKNTFDIVGDLTLNGVTKSVTLKTSKIGEGKDPWGGYRTGFEGTTELALKDFNINFALGPASEKVALTLEVEGVKQ